MTVLEETEVSLAARALTGANATLTRLQQEDTRARQRRAQCERDVQQCQGVQQKAITSARVRSAREDINDIYKDPAVVAAGIDVRCANEKLNEAEQNETRLRQALAKAEQDVTHCTRNYNDAVRKARVMTARDLA